MTIIYDFMEPTRRDVWVCDVIQYCIHLHRTSKWVSQYIQPITPHKDNQLSADVKQGWGGRVRMHALKRIRIMNSTWLYWYYYRMG